MYKEYFHTYQPVAAPRGSSVVISELYVFVLRKDQSIQGRYVKPSI